MTHSELITAAIIEVIQSGKINSVEDVANLAKFASVKLGTTFEQGVLLVDEIMTQELERVNLELSL